MNLKGLTPFNPMQVASSAKATMDSARKREQAMEQWVYSVVNARTDASPQRVREVCHEILRHAVQLGRDTPLDGMELFTFFLRVTKRWALLGEPIQHFPSRLPNNMREVGIMKLAEEAADVHSQMKGQ